MKEDEFLALLDQADSELDSFPFWASFKKACANYPIKGLKSKLTPGRQALLILWQANTQAKDETGNIINFDLAGDLMEDRLESLKENLIGHFVDEELDDRALRKFFRSVVERIKVS